MVEPWPNSFSIPRGAHPPSPPTPEGAYAFFTMLGRYKVCRALGKERPEERLLSSNGSTLVARAEPWSPERTGRVHFPSVKEQANVPD